MSGPAGTLMELLNFIVHGINATVRGRPGPLRGANAFAGWS
ncbi:MULTISPECIES: hypothetical protein [Streptomyces]